METTFIKLKKSQPSLIAIRFALMVGILVFTVTPMKSQTFNSTTDAEKAQSGSNGNSINYSVSTTNSAAPLNKPGLHAPEFNDPNYEAKKIEWIKNYPDEYNAFLKNTTTPSVIINKGTTAEGKHLNSDYHQKIAEHAPNINDTDYEAKKAEWINNYPQEYEQITNSTYVTTQPAIENNQSVSTQTTEQTNSQKNNTGIITKMGEHAPDINDPNYEVKKAAWIQNYPEEYNACLKNSSKPYTNVSTGVNPVVYKTGIKVAEHAPDLNDPDYAVKKAAWIKNYPEEYNAVMNNAVNSNSSNNEGTTEPNQPVKKTSVASTDNTVNDVTKPNKNK